MKIRIHESIIFFVVLYGCETWSVTVNYENSVLRRIFRPKGDEMIRGWRKATSRKPLERPRHRWVVNVKWFLDRYDGVIWIE
jgi:hypothetical protein